MIQPTYTELPLTLFAIELQGYQSINRQTAQYDSTLRLESNQVKCSIGLKTLAATSSHLSCVAWCMHISIAMRLRWSTGNAWSRCRCTRAEMPRARPVVGLAKRWKRRRHRAGSATATMALALLRRSRSVLSLHWHRNCLKSRQLSQLGSVEEGASSREEATRAGLARESIIPTVPSLQVTASFSHRRRHLDLSRPKPKVHIKNCQTRIFVSAEAHTYAWTVSRTCQERQPHNIWTTDHLGLCKGPLVMPPAVEARVIMQLRSRAAVILRDLIIGGSGIDTRLNEN